MRRASRNRLCLAAVVIWSCLAFPSADAVATTSSEFGQSPAPLTALATAQAERSRAHDDMRAAQAEWMAGEVGLNGLDSSRWRERLDTQRRLRRDFDGRKRSFHASLIREFEVLSSLVGNAAAPLPRERLVQTLAGFEGLFLDLKTYLEMELLAIGGRTRWLAREPVDGDIDLVDSTTILIRELRNDFERVGSGATVSPDAIAAGCTKAADIVRQLQSRLSNSPWDGYYDALGGMASPVRVVPQPMRLTRPAEPGLLSNPSAPDSRAVIAVRTGSAFLGIWEAGFGTDNFYRVELKRGNRGILIGIYEAVVKSEDRRSTFNFQLNLEEDRSSSNPDELNAAWSDMNSKARGRVMLRLRNGQMSIQALESPKGFRPNVFDPAKLMVRR